MFEDLRKKSFKRTLFGPIVMMIMGAVALVFLFPRLMEVLRGTAAFETLEPDEITDNMMVDVSIDVNFGCYMYEAEENTQTHRTRTTDLYYVIWTGDDNATDYRYMGIRVPVSDKNKMEEMAEAAYNEMRSDPILYSGEIQKMPSEDYKYFKEYFLDAGWTEKEIEENTLPYFINTKAMQTDTVVVICVFSAAALFFFLLAVWLIVSAAKGRLLKTIKKELADAGFGEAEADLEYQTAEILNEPENLRVGRRLTFFMIGNKPHAVVNDAIVWAYQKTTTHRTNGIKTGTSYSVSLNVINKEKYESQHRFEKKQFDLAVAGEKNAREVLGYINQTMPWVMLGYDNDLNRLYHNNCQEFLEILYLKTDRSQSGFVE